MSNVAERREQDRRVAWFDRGIRQARGYLGIERRPWEGTKQVLRLPELRLQEQRPSRRRGPSQVKAEAKATSAGRSDHGGWFAYPTPG